jgi:hypothetical protein
MVKFGLFEVGKKDAVQVYEGGYMELDAKGWVRIFDGEPSIWGSSWAPARLVGAIHLDKGQSVRRISPD